MWTPESQVSLEWLALRAALARRRARSWLTRLFDSSVVWREPGDSRARLIVIEGRGRVERGSRRNRTARNSTGLPPSSGRTS